MFIIICSSSSSVIFSYQIGFCVDGVSIVCRLLQSGVGRWQRSRLRREVEVCVVEHLRARPRVPFAFADRTVVSYAFSLFTADTLRRGLVGYEL